MELTSLILNYECLSSYWLLQIWKLAWKMATPGLKIRSEISRAVHPTTHSTGKNSKGQMRNSYLSV